MVCMLLCVLMKKLFVLMMMLLGVSVWTAPVSMARTDADAKPVVKKKARKVAGMTPVAKALAEAGYLSDDEALPKAKYYLFICSASWCPPCRALMPQIVEEYEKKMKKDKKVSLVLLCCDRTEEKGKEYLAHYETDMPGVMFSQVAEMLNLPKPNGIPAAIVVNAKGEVVAEEHGSALLQWKELVKRKPQKRSKD